MQYILGSCFTKMIKQPHFQSHHEYSGDWIINVKIRSIESIYELVQDNIIMVS